MRTTLALLAGVSRLIGAGHLVTAQTTLATAIERLETVEAARLDLMDIYQQCQKGAETLVSIQNRLEQARQVSLLAASDAMGSA